MDSDCFKVSPSDFCQSTSTHKVCLFVANDQPKPLNVIVEARDGDFMDTESRVARSEPAVQTVDERLHMR